MSLPDSNRRKYWLSGAARRAGVLGRYVAKVKQDKRTEYDGIVKKMVAANRQHKGDNWVTYQVEYGEAITLYFVSTRTNYAAIDEGQKAFLGALESSYGAAGMEKLLADGDRCLISVRTEIRTRRPDLSSNLPRDNAALSDLVGKSRVLRIVMTRTRPGHGPDYETQLRAIKEACERQTPNRVPMLQIFRMQASPFGNSREHTRTDFFLIVERKLEIRPPGPSHQTMRSALALRSPASAFQGRQDSTSLTGAPTAHLKS
jgi:hypothetical protein